MAAKRQTDDGPAGRSYLLGDFYSFHTSPATEFSARDTGRWSAFKIISADDESLCLAILDAVFDHSPTLAEVQGLVVAQQERRDGRYLPAVSFVAREDKYRLEDLRFLVAGEIAAGDALLVAGCVNYAGWLWASLTAEDVWRRKHDRAVYEDEVQRSWAAASARMAAEAQRWATRLKTLTWDQILAETPFSRWDLHPPFPPPEFVAAARAQIHATARALQALGTKPRRGEVRAILKACVDWFNVRDAEFGGVIETEEREEIYEVLEELAVVARQKALLPEIDRWRNW